MAFLLYEHVSNNGNSVLKPTGENFRLAGYNLIYKTWENKGRPLDTGWHVGADELIRLHSDGVHSYNTRRLLIDFDPRSKWRIGIIELLDVYAFTYGYDSKEPVWTPLMLRMKDLYYKEFEAEISQDEKKRFLDNIPIDTNNSDFVEFLYLNGPDKGWNWGRSGMTNAVFLEGEARDYFRQFF